MDLHLASLSTRATKTDFAIICYHFTNENRPRLPNTSENLKAFFELKRRCRIPSVCSRPPAHKPGCVEQRRRRARGGRVPALSSMQHGCLHTDVPGSCSAPPAAASSAQRPRQAQLQRGAPRAAQPSTCLGELSPHRNRDGCGVGGCSWLRAGPRTSQHSPLLAPCSPTAVLSSGLLPPADSSACEIAARS